MSSLSIFLKTAGAVIIIGGVITVGTVSILVAHAYIRSRFSKKE